MEESNIIEQEGSDDVSSPFSDEIEDMEDDQNDVDDQQLYRMEKEVLASPYNYDKHVALINALRKYGELERLRESRRRFSATFPLTPTLWLEWINDERRLETPWEEVRTLFEKAVQDYLSVKVWMEYVQVACGNLGPNEVRELFERALSHVGLHVADGRLIWDAYRVLESALSSADGNSDMLLQIHKRQLSIPLISAEETKQEFIEIFGEEKFDAALAQAYDSAFEELKPVSVYEQELQSSNYSLDAYLRYLDYEEGHRENASSNEGKKEKAKEKAVPNIARLQCLYERAIADHCLDVNLWLRYVAWLDKRFASSRSIIEVVLPVYERAIRNISWSASLWSRYALAWERSNVEQWCEKADSIFIRATTESGFSSAVDACELWLTWAYQKRRAADQGLVSSPEVLEVFEKGANFLKEKFGHRGWDPSTIYSRSWAAYLATQAHRLDNGTAPENLLKARELWHDILASDGNGRLASVWMDYYHLERRCGDPASIRKMLYNALNSVTDFPDYIASTLRQFELEEGSLKDLDEAEERIRRQKSRLEERKLQQHSLTTTKQQGRGRKDFGAHQPKMEESAHQRPSKRKNLDSQQRPVEPKKVKVEPKPFKAEPPTPEKREFKKPDRNLSEAERRRRTVFVSNLDFRLTEAQLREIFDGFGIGEVVDVTLKKQVTGRSKGFGYVEFESPESAENALTKDRHLIDGRPVYVSEYKERGGETSQMERAAGIGAKNAAAEKYHFGAGLEKNKLFVRNIPKHAGEADLKSIFEPFGSLKSIRLVTFPSGQSKGIAYIEYMDEESASKALSTDGQFLFEKQLSVAISNPPPRRTGNFLAPQRFQPQTNREEPKKDEQLMPPPKMLLPRVLGAGGKKTRLDL